MKGKKAKDLFYMLKLKVTVSGGVENALNGQEMEDRVFISALRVMQTAMRRLKMAVVHFLGLLMEPFILHGSCIHHSCLTLGSHIIPTTALHSPYPD